MTCRRPDRDRPSIARREATIEAVIEAPGAIEPATVAAVQAMDAAEAALRRLLGNREITPDDYDARWASLVETPPPAVLKARMEQSAHGAPGSRQGGGGHRSPRRAGASAVRNAYAPAVIGL